MAKTLDQIQESVRVKARDGDLTLNTSINLTQVNSIYRRMTAAAPWSELRRRASLAAATVADQQEYTWDTAMPRFTDVISVEIQNASIDNSVFGEIVFGVDTFTSSSVGDTWKRIVPAPSEYEKNLAARMASEAIPRFYELFHDGTDNKIGLYPAPSASGDAVRVTGIIEPDELTGLGSGTIFLSKDADDAFEWLIAGHFIEVHGTDAQYSAQAKQTGASIISRLLGVEVTPEELSV